jgi:hypothetical protein
MKSTIVLICSSDTLSDGIDTGAATLDLDFCVGLMSSILKQALNQTVYSNPCSGHLHQNFLPTGKHGSLTSPALSTQAESSRRIDGKGNPLSCFFVNLAYCSSCHMSKIYKVTVSGLAPDVWEMVVEFPDDFANKHSESALENTAKALSEQAIGRRWLKMNPDASEVPKFVQSFLVELFPGFDTESVTPAGIGPFRTESGVRVWMINGFFSFGIGAPPHLGFGGAW